MGATIYKPNPGRKSLQKLLGGLFMAIGATMGCLFMVCGLASLPLIIGQLGRGDRPDNTWLFGLMVPCGGLVFVVAFIAIGAVFFFDAGPEQLELSSRALSYSKGKTTTTLLLNEINRIGSRWQKGRRYGHWVLVITDYAGQKIELDIPQGVYLASFDVQPMLQDLLPRLPDTTEIEPRVQEYIDTGRMKR